MSTEDNELANWYTASKAAEVIGKNSKRTVKPEYMRTLDRLGKVHTKKIGDRTKLYYKPDVDAYRVSSTRGRRKKIKPAA